MINRMVKCFKHEMKQVGGDHYPKYERSLVLDFEGLLLDWGIMGDDGTMDTAGIVEKEDGSVELVYAGDIQFVRPGWKEIQ